MKNTFTLITLLIAGAFAVTSCDNGNADVVLLDSPPSVELFSVPTVVEGGNNVNFGAKMMDGATPELSKSPLASYSYVLTDTTTLDEFSSGSESTSGRMDSVAVSVSTTDVPVGVYYLYFRATDQANLTTEVENIVEVIEAFESIGVIGSATPGGWNTDTDMTKDAEDPCVWTISGITLIDGEAKFRANNEWTVNWGAGDFPGGTGTQDGANIPVPAGEYNVTLNACSGEYTFEEAD